MTTTIDALIRDLRSTCPECEGTGSLTSTTRGGRIVEAYQKPCWVCEYVTAAVQRTWELAKLEMK